MKPDEISIGFLLFAIVNNALNLGFFCSSISWGGLEMNVARFAHSFAQQGWKVSVFAVPDTPLFEKATSLGLKPIPIRHHRKYFDLKAVQNWKSLIEKEQIDVVWIRDTRDMQVAGLAKQKAEGNVKLVYQQAMQLGVDKKDVFHTQRFQRIDAWIAPLEFLAKQVQKRTKFPSDRIHVIPLGTKANRFQNLPEKKEARKQLNLPKHAVIGGLVGRFDPLKGQYFMVELVAKMQHQYPDFHLMLVGEPTKHEGDEHYKSILDLVAKEKLQDRVHILPFMSDIEKAYAAMDIAIMASAGETFGMVTIEAMMSGLPVIGTNTSGTPEILGQGKFGMLYTPNQLNEAATGLEQLLQSEEKRRSIGMKAQKHALKYYSMKSVMNQLENLVKKL